MKTFKGLLVAGATALTLVGCGGGGGDGGGSGVEAGKAETLYPLSTVLSNYVNNSSNVSFTVAGSVSYQGNTASLTGSGTFRETTASSTFNGTSALRKTQTTSGELIIEGTREPINDVTNYYFNSNYQPLGYTTSDGYCVSSNVNSIPASVAAGKSGNWYTTECYTNSSKAVLTGTSITSYQINYVTDETADLVLNQIFTDSSGKISIPVKSTYRITSNGSITFKEQNATAEYDGLLLNLTLKAN